ncbi:hypothetical protein NA57DRAFT_59386 [Rhizodiscina lignyota]|uniref:Methyltransferase domain-containing protein n=1 Tax=Rhizodiscina lignyota TaxID=1504668 RepID=A0A9P4I7G8_9PEZI|nr:hypothetical protein NA57DRAFT_59386 [Rhizodiscina lignyota]
MAVNEDKKFGNWFKDNPKPNEEWYESDINIHLKGDARSFWEQYTGLKGDALENHLYPLRDKAFGMGEYPCVGTWDFLQYRIPMVVHDYDALITRLKHNEKVLDIGCCFGQVLRHLLVDSGAPSENMYATDLHPQLWELGFELFCDRERMKAHFIAGDVLSISNPLWKLDVKFGIVLAEQFLHLFSWNQNKSILRQLVTNLTKPGTQVIGFQTANVNAQEYKTQWGHMYFHNVESLEKLWKEVGEETGTSWTVDAKLLSVSDAGYPKKFQDWFGSSGRYIFFVITRNED